MHASVSFRNFRRGPCWNCVELRGVYVRVRGGGGMVDDA